MKKNILLSMLLTMLMISAVSAQMEKSKVAIVTGSITKGNYGVNLEIANRYTHGNLHHGAIEILTKPEEDTTYRFELEVTSQPIYIKLHFINPVNKSITASLNLVPVSAGDSVAIVYDKETSSYQFNGNVAYKFKWFYETQLKVDEKKKTRPSLLTNNTGEQFLTNLINIYDYHLGLLENAKSEFDAETYQLLRTDIISNYEGAAYYQMYIFKFYYAYNKPMLGENCIRFFETSFLKRPVFAIDNKIAIESIYYSEYLLQKMRAEKLYYKIKENIAPGNLYENVKNSSYKGELKDKMLLSLMYFNGLGFSNMDSIRTDALKNLKIPSYRRELMELININQKGNHVMGFEFVDAKGKKYSIADFKGKVVLVDLWFTGCKGCIQLAEELPSIEEHFKDDPKMVFVSLSTDVDREKWLKSINPTNNGYKHYVTAHTVYLNTGGKGPFQTFVQRYNPTLTFPRLVLINKEGKIADPNCIKPYGKNKQQLLELLHKTLLE